METKRHIVKRNYREYLSANDRWALTGTWWADQLPIVFPDRFSADLEVSRQEEIETRMNRKYGDPPGGRNRFYSSELADWEEENLMMAKLSGRNV